MPCSPKKAQKLLKEGKAKVLKKAPFTLKLIYGSSGYKQKIIAGMDSGSKVIGTAAIANGHSIYQSETDLRGEEVKRKMEQKSMYRRNRRGRKTRYRKPRFLNRKASIRSNRLPPSVKHKLDAHLREKKYMESVLPISNWYVETANFDIHKISNPNISKKVGVSYQEGPQLGFYNTKAYILSRDNYTCQKCKKNKDGLKLHVHHIIFKSREGANTPNNLMTLCNLCHDKLHRHKNAEKESLKLQKLIVRSTKHATEISILKSMLIKNFGFFQETFGYITKFNRESIGLNKSHTNDAICIASQGEIVRKSNQILIKKLVSKGDYQQTKGSRSEKKIPTGKLFGLRKFDLIKTQKGTGFVKGKRSSGFFALSDIFGKVICSSVNIKKKCKKIFSRKLILLRMEVYCD